MSSQQTELSRQISFRTERSLSLCYGNHGSVLTDIIVRTRTVIRVQGRPSHHVINHLLLWGFKEMNGTMYTKVKRRIKETEKRKRKTWNYYYTEIHRGLCGVRTGSNNVPHSRFCFVLAFFQLHFIL
jgi:hypothetical protein